MNKEYFIKLTDHWDGNAIYFRKTIFLQDVKSLETKQMYDLKMYNDPNYKNLTDEMCKEMYGILCTEISYRQGGYNLVKETQEKIIKLMEEL